MLMWIFEDLAFSTKIIQEKKIHEKERIILLKNTVIIGLHISVSLSNLYSIFQRLSIISFLNLGESANTKKR